MLEYLAAAIIVLKPEDDFMYLIAEYFRSQKTSSDILISKTDFLSTKTMSNMTDKF